MEVASGPKDDTSLTVLVAMLARFEAIPVGFANAACLSSIFFNVKALAIDATPSEFECASAAIGEDVDWAEDVSAIGKTDEICEAIVAATSDTTEAKPVADVAYIMCEVSIDTIEGMLETSEASVAALVEIREVIGACIEVEVCGFSEVEYRVDAL